VGDPGYYTITELADRVAMSPRTIRSHRGRRLLDPPVRRGRSAFYTDSHVSRLEKIKDLQDRGFNLAAIDALIGARPAGDADTLAAVLRPLAARHPHLLPALARHRVIDRDLQVIRPEVLGAALALRQAGVSGEAALRVLGATLDGAERTAAELRRFALAGTSAPPDRLARLLDVLLLEAFRLAVTAARA